MRNFIVLCLLFGCSTGYSPKKWLLETDDTKILLDTNTSGQLVFSNIANTKNDFNWVSSSSPVPFISNVAVDGKNYTTKWIYKSVTHTEHGIVFEYTNQYPAIELTAIFEAHKGRGPVRYNITLKNISETAITIYSAESIELNIPNEKNENFITYINDDASHPDSIGVYRELLETNYERTLAISEYHDWIPFVAVDAGNQYGMYIGWEWSIGRISINNSLSTIKIKAGISDDFRTDIAAGETFYVPPAFIGAYHGDFDECGNSLRKYLFNHSMPELIRKDSSYPKLEWNAFAPTGKDLGSWDPVESKYYPFIDDIAPLGFEEVVIDIGWWSSYGDPGNIITDSIDWPRGMKAAAKYAQDRNIRFGLYSNEPENLTSDSGFAEKIRDITYLIKGLGADFYRSDATAGPIIAGTYGSGQRAKYKEDVSYWSIYSFYRIIDSLYRSIPGFLWENCSNGGGLKDYGAVRRSSKIQNQDVYYPHEARRAFYDASHVFHPMQLACIVGSWSPWQASGSVYEFRSAALGAFYWHPDAPNGGNGGPVWTDQHKADIKRAVETYKHKLRPLIRNADLYHIFPRPDNLNWDGIEYFDPATNKGVVYIFKPKAGNDIQKIKLKGLNPSINYKVSFEDGTNQPVLIRGSVLMNEGIEVTLKGELVSELMFFEQ